MENGETKIEDYAFLSDTQTGALVSRDGCVDWLCLPRFDSGACFASLLGTRDNGHWRFWAEKKIEKKTRRNLGEALILLKESEKGKGAVGLIDFIPSRGGEPDKNFTVEGSSGVGAMESELN